MTIKEDLQSINLYPISDVQVLKVCEKRGLQAESEITNEIRLSAAYKLATADIYKWMAFVPSSISENGISFSISEADRKRFLDEANKVYEELEPGNQYGLNTITDRSNMW